MTSGHERDLISAISRLGRQAHSIGEAINLFQPLLAGEFGGAALLVDSVETGMSSAVAQFTAEFLDSRQFPFRGLYTAPLMVGRQKAGRLIACFGSFGVPGKSLPSLTSHLALQLSDVLARSGRGLPSLRVA